MRLLALLAAGLFVGGLFATDDKKESPKTGDKKDEKKVKDEEAILGTWYVESLDFGGPQGKLPLSADLKQLITFTKDGKKVSSQPDGKRDIEEEYKLDTTASPKAIDLKPEFKSKPDLGVYELDGDTLKICTNLLVDNRTRPTEVKADNEKQFVLMTLKRVKDDKKGEPKKDK